MSINKRLAQLMNYITIDITSGSQLQMAGSIKQTAVTSAILKASATGVISAATDGTDFVAPTRNLTINGVTYDLSTDRSWSISAFAGYTNLVQQPVRAAEAVTKGQAVYVSGANGTNKLVSKASNVAELSSSKTLGLIDATVSTNGTANVVTEGLLTGINTIGATIGDPVWLGTGGNLLYGISNKPLAPSHLVSIGIVTRVNANNGEIFVKVQNGFELGELHNVSAPNGFSTNNDGLFWETTTQLWKNKSIATVLGYTPANPANVVPYTGATGAVNLGNYDLTVNGITVGRGAGAVSSNIVIGASGALSSNTTGERNVAIGSSTLSTGNASSNIGIGWFALNSNSGDSNIALGSYALAYSNTGYNNVVIGDLAGQFANGNHNVLLGSHSGANLEGNENIAIGKYSMGYATGGLLNIALGEALLFNTTGGWNTAIGYYSLYSNTEGSYNIAIGASALTDNTIGSNNTAIGYFAGQNNVDGNFNVFIDSPGRYGITDNYSIWIGNPNHHTSTWLAGTLFLGDSSLVASTPSAAMVINSTTTGALLPRMTTTQKNAITSPATGLMVFDTTLGSFYYYNGANWVSYQSPLNGTGFVKVSGTTVSYDNSTYLTTTAAASSYVPYTGATGDVDLGTNKLTTEGVVDTTIPVFTYSGGNVTFIGQTGGYTYINGTTTPITGIIGALDLSGVFTGTFSLNVNVVTNQIVFANNNATTLSLPVLSTITGAFYIYFNSNLTSIS